MALLSYKEKLALIRPYTNLGINSRVNFSTREKWLITYYYNILSASGYFDKQDRKFTPKIKFVETKTIKKQYKEKGAPRLKGYFVQGASPSDKVRGGKIIKGNYEKIFIPLDLSQAIEDEADFKIEYPDEDFDFYEYVVDELNVKLSPYYDDLTFDSYFTIVLINGWELGQNKRAKTPKTKRKDGQAFSRDLEGEEKIDDLGSEIVSNFHNSQAKASAQQPELIKGIYFWKFLNQREPTPKERKAMKGKKKWKKRKK